MGPTEDEIVGWYHLLSGHEFEPPLGDNEGQGNLVCCSPCGLKESDTTELLNDNKKANKLQKLYKKSSHTLHYDIENYICILI